MTIARFLRELVRKAIDAERTIRQSRYMSNAAKHEAAARNAKNTVDYNFHKSMAAMWRRLSA